eukprot:TRINITY_DN8299_c0_g1_i1.p1 TRINITY_DN8299_c0_g1~~TRINITY_DN8299_c0_g1_i1.p1  ORF type:complete len:227 (+),score=39.66 TRINITY_DN8299_c0_g1_i1:89-769(+)
MTNELNLLTPEEITLLQKLDENEKNRREYLKGLAELTTDCLYRCLPVKWDLPFNYWQQRCLIYCGTAKYYVTETCENISIRELYNEKIAMWREKLWIERRLANSKYRSKIPSFYPEDVRLSENERPLERDTTRRLDFNLYQPVRIDGSILVKDNLTGEIKLMSPNHPQYWNIVWHGTPSRSIKSDLDPAIAKVRNYFTRFSNLVEESLDQKSIVDPLGLDRDEDVK